ncbi:MAG: hypothetical protein HP496_02575, partial [Nitrospira sp.]|nr:hypothetical protein [Nitrospira sp.]
NMLLTATSKPGENFADLEELYGRMLGQWVLELNHVSAVVGGFDSQQRHWGQEGVRFTPIAAARQAAAVAFLNGHAFETPAFAIKPDMAFYFKVPIEVAISRLLRGTRGQFKYYEAGMDMDLSPDVTESFRLFQSRILAEYDKIVDECGLLTMDATLEIETQQEQMRALVEEALRGYKPRRGTYGRRTLFWRRFEIPRSE